ncbi:MAG: guanylate kinase, partial [Planctomycetota bacterium]|nr:guanylate kinase [Planctomycetota bacterium]
EKRRHSGCGLRALLPWKHGGHHANMPRNTRTSGGTLFLLIGPSGVGKNTLIDRVLERFPDITYLVTVTTRPMRPGESQSDPYDFVSRAEFERRIKAGYFIEWKELFNGHLYGVPRGPVDKALREGVDLIKDVDVLGARDVIAAYGKRVCSVFVHLSSKTELKTRIIKRSGGKAPVDLADRVARAEMEIAKKDEFDHAVCNDDLDTASAALRKIIEERRAGGK